LLENLPHELREFYSGTAVFLPEDEVNQDLLHGYPVRLSVLPGHYARIIERLAGANMVEFMDASSVKVVNGIFGVTKDENVDRLIVDAVRANLFFKKAATVKLPSPSSLADLSLPPGHVLCVGKLDVDSFYNRIALPQHFRPYFALPEVWSDLAGLPGPRRPVHPVMTVLPMGWSHAVLLGQAVHEFVVDSLPEFGAGRRLASATARDLQPQRYVHCEYVDDLLTLEAALPDAPPVSFAALRAASAHYDDTGLLPKAAKAAWPQAESNIDERFTTGLGVDLSSLGIARPNVEKLMDTLRKTKVVISFGRLSPRAMQQLLGLWVWPLLLHRPFLSLMGEVFDFCQQPLPLIPRLLPPGILRELQYLVSLGPLVEVDLHDEVATSVIAFDASTRGGGVVYSPSIKDVRPVAALRELDGWYTRATETALQGPQAPASPPRFLLDLAHGPWKTAISVPWRKKEQHINELEMTTGVMALRWASRSRFFRGKRVVFLTDSRVCLGAFAKGRSSSRRLLYHCRRIAALSFASGIRPLWAWIPTDINPADGPSRGGW
jgi:hypothetical protein